MYEELATKYEEEELRRTEFQPPDNIDIKVFAKLINQVANETMEQFETQFNHLSMNSRFSANVNDLDDLDETFSREILLDVLSDV